MKVSKAEALKQKLAIAKLLANVKSPTHEPTLMYDSGWKEPK